MKNAKEGKSDDTSSEEDEESVKELVRSGSISAGLCQLCGFALV